MIVANWPDRCPDCGCQEFFVSSRVKSSLLLPEQRRERYRHNRVKYSCRDESCSCEWVVDLVTVDPVVFVSPRFNPLAIAAASEEDAKQIVSLDEESEGWKAFKLSGLIQRGAKRAELVAHMAANAAAEGETAPQEG